MRLIAISAAITVVVAPLALGLVAWWRSRSALVATPAPAPLPWHQVLTSALALTLAFNLQFFIQELFLVLPKAFTPGLRPTLYHNNHAWDGSHPLAELFQGTGALATLIVGACCAAGLSRARTSTVRLWLLWMCYCGVIMALAQVVVGAISPQSDVGRALKYLQFPDWLKLLAALVALLTMPAVSLWLLRRLLGSADDAHPAATPAARARLAFRWATLPALLAFVFIVPFRVPRETIEVLIVPAAVLLCGIPWMQAGAPGMVAQPAKVVLTRRLAYLLGAALGLLAVFQLLLRPGIRFD